MDPRDERQGSPGADPHAPAPGGGGVASPGQAAGVLLLLALLFFTVAGALGMALGIEGGLFLAQWLALLAPVVLFARLKGLSLRRTFYLERPTGREITGGVLVVLGGMPLALILAWVQGFFMEIPTDVLEDLQEMVTAETTGRLLWLLVLLAVTPAICEEFVFRGFFLSSTERRFALLPLLLLNGAVFGVFHLTPFRILPTALLGVLLALVVWRTRSIWTGVVMHLVNNGLIVILASSPLLEHWDTSMHDPPPGGVVLLGLGALAAGLYILFGPGGGPRSAGEGGSTTPRQGS